MTKISDFLGREIISNDLPSREKISDDDGKWVRKKIDCREVLTEEDLERFNELNIHHLNQFDYK